MNDAPALLVVCDTGPLIHLDQLDCLDLLADFSRVVVPDVVWREVEVHRPAAVNQQATRLERLKPREEPFNERNRHKPVATARGSDTLPPIAPVLVRQRPPIHANRLAVWGIVWFGKVHLLGVFLKTLDLVLRVEQKWLLLFILKQALLRG